MKRFAMLVLLLVWASEFVSAIVSMQTRTASNPPQEATRCRTGTCDIGVDGATECLSGLSLQ